ncbi:MAG: hypothetical protein RL722_2471 [Pseudomonadota bacterium]|jgi:iron complex outermembrane receptor protein
MSFHAARSALPAISTLSAYRVRALGSHAFRPHLLALCAAASLLPAAQAQTAGTAAGDASLEPVVVTGSARERRLIDAPYAITAVSADELRSAGPQVNLSEALTRVPGLTVANRSNYAQDLQISSRGFGARATFGVRGLRLYSDGIPASMPDGQGQVAHFDLAGASRVEVLRGPFSALYGNSSGGVIALFSAPVTVPSLELGADFGSFGLRQERLAMGTPLGQNADISASLAKFDIDGFRPNSAASRQLANVRVGFQDENDRLTFSASNQDQEADDPLGLTRTQFEADPRSTAPEAAQFKTHKTIRQTQLGLDWSHRLALGALDSVSLSTYTGSRGVSQPLAIPAATQNGNRHGGGLVDFDRTYGGLDGRVAFKLAQADIVAGVNYEQMIDDRRGYLSFTTTTPTPDYGTRGALKRDERNKAVTREAYVQSDWTLTDALSASAGLRSGKVTLSAEDHFILAGIPPAPNNGDDSGLLKFSYTNPVAGLRYLLAPGLAIFANLSRGFESPTLGELAYQGDGTPGFNSGLQPQTSRQKELGLKLRGGAGRPDVQATLFQIKTDNEIGVLTNAGGRSAFQNVGRTERKGAELAMTWRHSPSWRTQMALTRLEANYLDSFETCTAAGCTLTGTNNKATVPAGNRIAGTQPTLAYAEVAWKPDAAGELGLEIRGQGRTAVNDLNSDFASGFSVISLRYSRRITLGQHDQLELLTRIDNLADRAYAGSVIVNDGNGRFFEPGAPRNYLASLRWKHSW